MNKKDMYDKAFKTNNDANYSNYTLINNCLKILLYIL